MPRHSLKLQGIKMSWLCLIKDPEIARLEFIGGPGAGQAAVDYQRKIRGYPRQRREKVPGKQKISR